MRETQNVTLVLPKDILHKAKIIAIKQNSSLSNLLTQALIELVESQDGYEHARRRSLGMVRSGFDLGTRGNSTWKREV